MKFSDIEKHVKWEKYYSITDDKVWLDISCINNLPINFIREFQNKLHWRPLSMFQNFSIKTLKEFKDKINWSIYVSHHRNISDKFIKQFESYLDWSAIVSSFNRSEYFLRKYSKYFTDTAWKDVSIYQYLSEDFILDFADKFEVDIIVNMQGQHLSKDFLNKIQNTFKNHFKK